LFLGLRFGWFCGGKRPKEFSHSILDRRKGSALDSALRE
jgi:hypothetical protein